MAKLGEINYMQNLCDNERVHAVHKPFSDPHCAHYFYEIGVLLALMPPPPARLLDVGCGAGWTSRFFARRGYEVVGVDICPEMIEAAERVQQQERLENLRYRVGDYEEIADDDAFDIAVFYDSLHHAVDEVAALRMVWRALKPGGVCIASEPGHGHAQSAQAQAAVERFGVTEKDMPPSKVIAAACQAGFRSGQAYPHGFDVAQFIFRPTGRWLRLIPAWLGPARRLVRTLRVAWALQRCQRDNGIVVLTK